MEILITIGGWLLGAAQFVLHRLVALPALLAIRFSKATAFFIVFGIDVIQIPIFFYLYRRAEDALRRGRPVRRLQPTRERIERTPFGRFALSIGEMGVVFLSALPLYGGGMWSAVLLAYLLRMPRPRAVAYCLLGSFVGCWAIVLGFSAILSFWR